MRKKYANKERGLLWYGKGQDLFGKQFHVQDGSWAEFLGIRIYAHDSNNEHSEICLSLKKDGVKRLIDCLELALKNI